MIALPRKANRNVTMSIANGPATPVRRVLGIDPGLNITGYAVIEQGSRNAFIIREAGVVRSRRGDTFERRIQEIHDGIAEVLSSNNVDLVALEQLFSHYDRPKTAIIMGHARGVICLAAAAAGCPVHSIEPTRVKKVMTGNGRAAKWQMQDAVRGQLGLQETPKPADVADAMAIALCGLHLANNPLV